ncbi:hypothetical protein [Microbacterium sp. USHLN272]|uniref:hypothetical protein n=1 Tax=Microbacterium sp. USHLN272 TaxID=3081287 RepID=UPI0030162FD7
MSHARTDRSAASRVFLVLLVSAVVIGALVALFLVVEAQRATRAEAERVTASTAVALAASPLVSSSLADADRERATRTLEPYALEVIDAAGLDFITIMTAAGLRVTHPDLDEIGKPYLGTIPDRPQPLTEEFTGTLGPSVRTIVPVTGADGRLLGWVAAGVTTETISERCCDACPSPSASPPHSWRPGHSAPGRHGGSLDGSPGICLRVR